MVQARDTLQFAKMPNKHKSKVKTTAKEGSKGDAKHKVESEHMQEANASSQTSEANLLEANQALKTHFTTQLRKIITLNQEIKDRVGVFLERLTSAESHIGDLEDVASLTCKETSIH